MRVLIGEGWGFSPKEEAQPAVPRSLPLGHLQSITSGDVCLGVP